MFLKYNIKYIYNDLANITILESCIRYNSTDGYVQLYYDNKWNNWLDSKTVEDDVYTQYVYYKGTNYTDIVGNWEGLAYKSSTSSGTVKAPTVTMGSSYMTLKISTTASAGYVGSVWSSYKVDLTDYNYIIINRTTSAEASSSSCSFNISDTKQNKWTKAAGISILGSGDTTLDISNITGEYYLMFSLYYCSTKIYSIKLVQ